MTYTIKYSTSSKIDIKTSITYINNVLQNPFAGNRLRIEVQATVRNLKEYPYKHPIITDLLLTSYKIRFVQIKNYLLFYTVTEEIKTIYIVRFLYSRRNWQRILKSYVQYDEYLSKNTAYYVHENQEEYGLPTINGWGVVYLPIPIHLFIIILILTADNVLPPFAIIQVPLNGLLDTICKFSFRQPT